MKSSTQLLLVISATVVTGFIAATVRAADTPAEQSGAPGPGPLHTPPPEVMSIYDVDQNGVLDDDERAVLREDVASGKFIPPGAEGRRGGPRGPGGPGRRGLPPELTKKYDANNDGQLNDTERAALRADVESGKVKPPRGPEGRPNGGMNGRPPPEIMTQYDLNQDGKLDDTERAALRADVESGKITPPRRPGGRGPGGRRGPGAGAPSAGEGSL